LIAVEVNNFNFGNHIITVGINSIIIKVGVGIVKVVLKIHLIYKAKAVVAIAVEKLSFVVKVFITFTFITNLSLID
jgi:hypothetical protein